MPLIELSSTEVWGNEKSWSERCELSCRAAISASPYTALIGGNMTVEISIKLSNNQEVQALNASYRNKDKPTNVLSFPMIQPELISALSNTGNSDLLLGDIILAHDICANEADQKDISLQDHVAHLIVHGTLHLLGFDHKEETDAQHMEKLETHALATIGVSDPYAEIAIVR